MENNYYKREGLKPAYISRINMHSLLFLDKYFLRNCRMTVDSSASKSNIQYDDRGANKSLTIHKTYQNNRNNI